VEAQAKRWGGGAASALLLPILRAALQHREDPAAARAAAPEAGGGAGLAGALVGMARGASEQEAPELAVALTRIGTRS
jgi:hypothetical protein